MQPKDLLSIMQSNEREAALAYKQEPTEQRLTELLGIQARITELEVLVNSVQ